MTLRIFMPFTEIALVFFELASLEMTDGDLPLTAQRLVKEWLDLHRNELEEMWRTQRIVQLPPL